MTPQEIREWRLRNALTQTAAAKLLGVELQSFKQYEYGRRPVPKPIVLLAQYVDRYGAANLKER